MFDMRPGFRTSVASEWQRSRWFRALLLFTVGVYAFLRQYWHTHSHTFTHTHMYNGMYMNAINRRHSFVSRVWNSARIARRSRSVTNASAHSDAHEVNRAMHSYFTKFTGASSPSFFSRGFDAPEEWEIVSLRNEFLIRPSGR